MALVIDRRFMCPRDNASDPIGDALRADVVAYYKLGDVNDSGPNALHLTNNNSVPFSSGKVGSAPTFTSASSHTLSLAGNSAHDIGAGDFTFAFWLLSSGHSTMPIDMGGVGASDSYYVYLDPGGVSGFRFRFKFSPSGANYQAVGVTDLAFNTWHFCCLRGDRDGLLTARINNQDDLSADISSNTGAATTAGLFSLGGTTAYFFGGRLDEFGRWDRLITSDEESYLYNSGDGRALY